MCVHIHSLKSWMYIIDRCSNLAYTTIILLDANTGTHICMHTLQLAQAYMETFFVCKFIDASVITLVYACTHERLCRITSKKIVSLIIRQSPKYIQIMPGYWAHAALMQCRQKVNPTDIYNAHLMNIQQP